MKKISALVSVLVLSLSLAACKKEEKKEEGGAKKAEEGKKEEPKKEEPAKEEPKKEEPAAAGGEGGAANTGIAECDEYVSMMDKYLSCDKVPQAARDGAKQGLDAMKSGWGDMAGMPEEAKKAAADGCKQAVDALKQSASAMGCTL